MLMLVMAYGVFIALFKRFDFRVREGGNKRILEISIGVPSSSGISVEEIVDCLSLPRHDEYLGSSS